MPCCARRFHVVLGTMIFERVKDLFCGDREEGGQFRQQDGCYCTEMALNLVREHGAVDRPFLPENALDATCCVLCVLLPGRPSWHKPVQQGKCVCDSGYLSPAALIHGKTG